MAPAIPGSILGMWGQAQESVGTRFPILAFSLHPVRFSKSLQCPGAQFLVGGLRITPAAAWCSGEVLNEGTKKYQEQRTSAGTAQKWPFPGCPMACLMDSSLPLQKAKVRNKHHTWTQDRQRVGAATLCLCGRQEPETWKDGDGGATWLKTSRAWLAAWPETCAPAQPSGVPGPPAPGKQVWLVCAPEHSLWAVGGPGTESCMAERSYVFKDDGSADSGS